MPLPTLSSSSFEAILTEYLDACRWLDSLGIPISPNRISTYRSFLERLVGHYQNQKWDAINSELDGHLNSLYEASELSVIKHAFSGNPVQGLASRVNELVHGPASYLSENPSSSNRARNIAFELLVGARFHFAGIPVDFSLTSDVAARFNGIDLGIQCKRPSSTKQIHKNVKVALKQLARDFKGVSKRHQRGLVAIDIGKIINPEFKLLIADETTDLERRLSGITTGFVQRYLEGRSYGSHSRMLGILVRYSGMAVNKETNLYTYCQYYTLFSTSEKGSLNATIARELAGAMASSPSGGI